MAGDKTQNMDMMIKIAHELGELSSGMEGMQKSCHDIFGILDDMRKNGLPICETHRQRVDALEAKINEPRPTMNSNSFGSLSFGKWKASGVAIFVVGMLLAFAGGGYIAVKLAEVLKPVPYSGPRRTVEQPAQPTPTTVKTP